MDSETEKRIRILTKLADLQLKLKNELFKRGGLELVKEACKQAEPMTYREFYEELRLLEQVHPGFYSEPRKQVIFTELKWLSFKTFRTAVIYFLGHSHHAPLLGEFLDYITFLFCIPDLSISDQRKMREVNFAYWSSRRWDAMKAMHSGE